MLALLATLAAALVALHPTSIAAQPAPPAQRIALGLEGSWIVDLSTEGEIDLNLISILPGGVALATNAPSFVDEQTGERVYSTAGHGAWAPLGGNRYGFTVVFLYFSGAEENLFTLTVEGAVTLDTSGNRFSGTYGVAGSTAAGMPIFAEEGLPITGTRIRPPTR